MKTPARVRRLRRGSLTRRLIVLAAILSLAALALTGVALTAFFRTASLNRLEASLSEQAFALYGDAEFDDQGALVPPTRTDPRTTRVYSGLYWQIAEVLPNGGLRAAARSRSLFDTTLPGPPGGAAQLRSRSNDPVFYNAEGPDGRPLRVAALMARLPRAKATLVFVTAEDRSAVEEDSRQFAATTALALGALGLGLLGAVFLQVRVGLRPLFEIENEVADVRVGRKLRLGAGYPSEIQPLADELNALLDSNQQTVERQRTHVGNLAHALKTPLSVMLTEAEARPGELAEVVTRQASTMREQVEHHLRRARAAATAGGKGERTEVAAVLDELAVTLERIYADKGVEIDWRAPDDLMFRGERQDLMEIAGNVMDNACKWATGKVRAAALSTGRPDCFKLVVEDDGPGVPAEKREEMLKRGERLDERAPGSGLGLSIVAELARAYDGAVTLGDAADGGLRVEVVLPKAVV